MNQIDMGIGICHLWIAGRQFKKDISFIYDKDTEGNALEGYYYILSMIINE